MIFMIFVNLQKTRPHGAFAIQRMQGLAEHPLVAKCFGVKSIVRNVMWHSAKIACLISGLHVKSALARGWLVLSEV